MNCLADCCCLVEAVEGPSSTEVTEDTQDQKFDQRRLLAHAVVGVPVLKMAAFFDRIHDFKEQ